ncbi:Zn-dependent protease with chaperone function [Actinocorallia herbida]|uniref:Zn-dependent protease with chaperone function n=1 Tax=Actinocorallia herbida TaxID=58109 RepID=A0A3N1D119_9ACTN|nr:M56 family metallopeptidase [Actinocorallia herbida]ROO87200.1 Zn-dependent protease with chaperone function [Actinocorallia herbida]
MFDHFAWSVLIAPVLVVTGGVLVSGRLRPGTGAAVLAWSAVGAAFSSVINLVLFAAKALAELPSVGARFGWSHDTVLADTAHVPWVSWLSVALLPGCAIAAWRTWHRHRYGRSVARTLAALPDEQHIVLLEEPSPDAFAVPGSPGRIVVTSGMRDRLTDTQYAALLAHEQAHLEAGHHRLVLLADLAGAVHPALLWVARRVGYLVERDADERAAAEIGSRRTVANAIATAALASHATAPAAGLYLARPGAVPRRVRSLLSPDRRPLPPWAGLFPLAFAASSIVWTGEAAIDLHQLLDSAFQAGTQVR